MLHSPVCPTLLCGGVFVKCCFPLQSWEINEDDSHIFLPSIPPFPPAPWQTQILAACSRHQKVYKPCLPGSGLCRTQMIPIMQMTAAGWMGSRGRRSWTMLGGKGNLLRGLVSADALQVLGRDFPDFFSGHSTSSCFAAPALNVFSSKNSTCELQLVSVVSSHPHEGSSWPCCSLQL